MKIFVSAGEVSGDVHGSYLVRELKMLLPTAYFFGLGSENMAAAGVDIKFDLTGRGTIGILEALPNLFTIYSVFTKTKKLIRKEKPDLVILIDSQGFNLPLAKFCRALKIKTAYYIAPQEWLWGTPAGVKKVAQSVDLIVAIFQKEYESYKQADANVVYFGHPLLDIVSSHEARVAGQVCICPGSRTQEIKALLPILLKAAELLQKEIPDASFVIPAASSEIYNNINTMIRNSEFEIRNFRLASSSTYNCLHSSALALCASGTINLEASLLGTPNIMVYKLSRLTYWTGKYILRIDKKLKFFSMPNILLDRPVIPELVMADATPDKISAAAIKLLTDQELRAKTLAGLADLRRLLGQSGAIQQAARKIVSLI